MGKKLLKRVKIVVLPTNIKKGKPGNSRQCPIALAVKRQLGDNPSVGSDFFTVDYAEKSFEYGLPKSAQEFIQKFDKGEKVKPFSFVANERRKE